MEQITVCLSGDDRDRDYDLVWSADGSDEAYWDARIRCTTAIRCRVGLIARGDEREYNPVALACLDAACDHDSGDGEPGQCVGRVWYSVQSFDADTDMPAALRAQMVVL